MDTSPAPLQIAGQTAVVHDWLVVRGGAERILETILEVLPGAPVYTHVYNPDAFADSVISRHVVHASLINRLPAAAQHYRSYLPLMPFAVEQFDLRAYRYIFSISFATAHGVLARPNQQHIAYLCSPVRYAWHLYQDYLEAGNLRRGLRAGLARLVLHYLRLWDFSAAQRVDHYLAISEWIAECTRRAYRRQATVLYPPVDVRRFDPGQPREDYFMTAARLVPYKKIDRIIKSFNQTGYPLLVVGDGPERHRLARKAGPSVRLLGHLPDEQVAALMNRARGYVYMAEEDFGISLVEAQAAGCPVIAYRSGGAQETVIEGQTGIFYDAQTPEALEEAVCAFVHAPKFDRQALRSNAERYSREKFVERLRCTLAQLPA